MDVKDIQAGLKKYKNIEKRFEEEIVNGFKIINAIPAIITIATVW